MSMSPSLYVKLMTSFLSFWSIKFCYSPPKQSKTEVPSRRIAEVVGSRKQIEEKKKKMGKRGGETENPHDSQSPILIVVST